MKRIPKIDLHLHIDGSVYPETALALAQEQGLPEGRSRWRRSPAGW